MIDAQKWFYYNNNWHVQKNFNDLVPQEPNRIYEVFRIVNGVPLFLEDHYARFEHSLSQLSIANPIAFSDLKELISHLIKKNNVSVYNARFELILDEKQVALAIYLTPFSYPTKKQQAEGVKVNTFQIERKNPHIKQSNINNSVRNRIKDLLNAENVYEVLLIDYKGNITEGSRSNVFFVKDNCIFSPPTKQVLEGITRMKVIQIARKLNIKENYEPIPESAIEQFQACFITGTSPKILPVFSIGRTEFDVNNKIMQRLSAEFNTMINNYCSIE